MRHGKGVGLALPFLLLLLCEAWGRFFGLRIVLTLGLRADMMKVYAKRIEVLATKAVTARVWG